MLRLRDIVRAGRRLYLPLQDWAIRSIATLARRGDYVRERTKGDDPLQHAQRAAVYVHFDRGGIVHDYVLHQLCELVDAGYRVTFVSNAQQFPNESRARVLPLCKELIWRFNIGYDFGAYKDGIASLGSLSRLDSLILMNDSVYGPFRNLREILANVDQSTTDFWGIADSFENRHHIQTFFMLFMPTALRSAAFYRFWRELPYVDHRMWVIRNAEVRLTQVLQGAKLQTAVLAPYNAVATTVKGRLQHEIPYGVEPATYERFCAKILEDGIVNPTHYFWDVLITDYACPFIKRDLLTSNPSDVPGTSQWRRVIATHTDYDVDLIERHLTQ